MEPRLIGEFARKQNIGMQNMNAITGSANVASPMQPPVQAALGRLLGAVDTLAGEAEALHRRLDPVMLSASATQGSSGSTLGQDSGVSIADTIDELTRKVNAIRHNVINDAHERLAV